MHTTDEITVRQIQSMGGDHMVVAAARVSVSGEAAAKELTLEVKEHAGLINFLMKHRHGTPFEHGAITFFVHAPIFVFREWHRHRIGQSYNEQSARYGTLPPVFWVPKRDRKLVPVEGFKPARPQFQAATEQQHEAFCQMLRDAYGMAYGTYQTLIDNGYAKEAARAVLPVGIYSSMWVTMNPRSLMAFLSLRTHEPAAKFVSYPQAEIEEAARACEECLRTGWPLTHAAFVANGRVAP